MIWYNFIFSNRIFFRVSRHLAFWLVFSIWYLFLCGGYGDSLDYYLLALPILYSILPVCILSTYVTLYVLIPRFLLTKKYKKFILALFVLCVAYPLVVTFDPVPFFFNHSQFEKDHLYMFDGIFDGQDMFRLKLSVWNGWGFTVAVGGVAAVIKLVKNYYIENSENERLLQKKNSHELELLKSQLNSRFLFDALQSIQQHVRKQSPGASKLILKLSDLLSYILYENDEVTVPLNKEIEIIEGYLHLEREGHGNGLDIQVTQQGEVHEKRIVPLVLLPLVESCFEHSTLEQQEGAGISLDFTVTELALLVTLKISNLPSFTHDMFQQSLRIKNVKQRLNSFYQGKHVLEIAAEDQNYVVQLEMSI